MTQPAPRPTLLPYTTLFRSWHREQDADALALDALRQRVGVEVRRQDVGRPRVERRIHERTRRVGERRGVQHAVRGGHGRELVDRKSTRLNSSHITNSYAVFC